jgi:hypothetical protein
MRAAVEYPRESRGYCKACWVLLLGRVGEFSRMLAKVLHEFRFPPSATNSAGIAKSAVLTANGTAGSYAVTGKAGTATNSPGF